MEDWGQFVLIDVSRKNYSYTRLNEIYKITQINEMKETERTGESGETCETCETCETYETNETDKMNEMDEFNENKTRGLSYIIKKIIFSIFYLSLKITNSYIYNETGLVIDGNRRVFSSRYLL
jgi:hypothetical protein